MSRVESWDEYERQCIAAYGGGYQTDELRKVFHHGISTVFNSLRANYPIEDMKGGESQAEELRIAKARAAELDNAIDVMLRQFGEPPHSWQRLLFHIQQCIRRRAALASACLNAVGFLGGCSIMAREQVAETLIEAVKPIVSGEES